MVKPKEEAPPVNKDPNKKRDLPLKNTGTSGDGSSGKAGQKQSTR